MAPASLDGAVLIEAIPDAGIANAPELAAEAGRRRLFAAVPALAMIGDPPARQAIVLIIAARVVQGPGLVSAIAAAVHLDAERHAAACALDRLGRPEARAAITQLLREQPSGK